MKNVYGNAITLTIYGESHGAGVGAVLDGIAPGITIDTDFIDAEMEKRRASSSISTSRREADKVEFLSGVYQGKTTGTPISIFIKNENVRSKDYNGIMNVPRPGHADYTALAKFLGHSDPRGGGHFSGRVTAPVVAAGAICRAALKQQGITIATRLARCAGISDAPLPETEAELLKAADQLNRSNFAVLDQAAGEKMQQAILDAKASLDSVGGILETFILGLPAGLGEPFFGSVESELAHVFFSIPAVKGIEFGLGFGFADLRGSEANDPFIFEGDTLKTTTNNNGGLNGGITNGMPVVFRAVVKPTSSIAKLQRTANLETKQVEDFELHGRHDPCVLHRGRAVADAVTALVLLDLISQRYGTLGQINNK